MAKLQLNMNKAGPVFATNQNEVSSLAFPLNPATTGNTPHNITRDNRESNITDSPSCRLSLHVQPKLSLFAHPDPGWWKSQFSSDPQSNFSTRLNATFVQTNKDHKKKKKSNKLSLRELDCVLDPLTHTQMCLKT